MREIKFRGYDIKLNQWVYGYYVKHIDSTFNPFGSTEKEREQWYKEHTHHYIVQDGFSDWDMSRGLSFNEVDEYSIGQYVEVYDCDNKPIYENDIVEYNGQKGIVRFIFGRFQIVFEEEVVLSLYEALLDKYKLKVIGTKYEYLKEIKRMTEPTKIVLNSDATDEMIEIGKKIYPNSEIIKKGE